MTILSMSTQPSQRHIAVLMESNLYAKINLDPREQPKVCLL